MTFNSIISKAAVALLCMAAATPLCVAQKGAQKKGNVLDLKTSITDSSVVFPESFEADTQKMLEGWYMKNYTATDRRYEELGDTDTSDETIIARLKALPTIIEMPFNDVVRTYIDRYTKRGRKQVAALLGMSLYYMPVFEQALEEQGLPLELKYLPVIESGLDPNAVSRHGATGLWQFMLGTAKGLGLEVNSLVDERRDPYLASERAASYLKDLYDTYGDWSLAIAAYNCGPGNVNKALRRAGGDPKTTDFWGIYYYLSPETRGYVPMFIAANYVMNYYQDHNISPVLAVKPLVTDTLHITDRVHFKQISQVLDIPIDELRILNPQFRADIIPGTPDTPYTLILPSQQVHAYLMSEDQIKELDSDKYVPRGVVEPGDVPSDALLAIDDGTTVAAPPAETDNEAPELYDNTFDTGRGKQITIHKVAPGETLASIAKEYGMSVQELKQRNNLRRNAVRVGQQLKVGSEAAAAESQSRAPLHAEISENDDAIWQAPAATPRKSSKKANTASKKKTTKPKAPATVDHTIKNGESLSSISKKYGVSVAEIKKANGMKDDDLRAGRQLKIPNKSGAASKVRKSSSKKSKSSASKSSKKKSSKSKSKKKRR